MKVRSPSNTRAMNAPKGFVQTRISPRKIAICSIPTPVIVLSSKLLRTKKRVDQVNKQSQRCDSGNNIVHDELFSLQLVASLREGPADQQASTSDSHVE